MEESAHTRTYSWADPSELGAGARRLSGMAFLSRLVEEQTEVPIGATLGFRLSAVGEGTTTFALDPVGAHLFNPIGGVHGGWYAAVLDAPLGASLHSTLPAGVGYTTLELKVNVVRPVKPGQSDLRAEGRVLHRGRTTAVTEAQILDAEGKVYAHATSTCLILGG